MKPKRVFPVLGFDGQKLWTSEMGLKLGSANVNAVPEGCTQGPAERPTFNWMREGIQPMEGGKFMVVDKQKKPTKRARAETPITVSKRKRQEISLSSDEGEDEDYVPKGMKIDRFYARKIVYICLFPGKVTVSSTTRPSRKK